MGRHGKCPSADLSALRLECPPTDEERDEYYFGLFSRPRLVARTGTSRWQGRYGWSDPGKTLHTVGRHPIAEKWNRSDALLDGNSLPSQIIKALSGLRWTAIDILRVGYVVDEHGHRSSSYDDFPVTMLITVEPDTVRWEKASEVVELCKLILFSYGMVDIEVEMKESKLQAPASFVQPTSAPVPSDTESAEVAARVRSCTLSEPWANYELRLSDYLGTMITTLRHPTIAGTKGLYLQIKSGNSPPFMALLTCRHVVLPSPAEDWLLPYHDETASQGAVVQLSDAVMEETKSMLNYYPVHMLQLQEKLELEQSAGGDENKIQRLRSQINYYQPFVDRAREDLHHLSSWREPASRIIGHIFFSPPLSVVGDVALDYALVKIDVTKHEKKPTNRVWLGERPVVEMHRRETALSAITGMDIEGTMTLQGFVPEDELLRPTESPSFVKWGTSRIVGKYGATTDLTLGLVNEIKSVVRSVHDGGPEITSRELCVVRPQSFPLSSYGPQPMYPTFSRRSDSGSCVWCLDGRVVGIVTSGHEGLSDTTYVTPLEGWLAHMKTCGLEATIVHGS